MQLKYHMVTIEDLVPQGHFLRKLERNCFDAVVKADLEKENTPAYKEMLKWRQVWCEGTFSAQKWGHNLARTPRRGLGAGEDRCLLSATAMNLKRMIKHMI